jgi:hypothetical protein
VLEKLNDGKTTFEKTRKKYDTIYRTYPDVKPDYPDDVQSRIKEISLEEKEHNAEINRLKVLFREEMQKSHPVRSFRKEYLREENIISVFESALTRTLGMETNHLYDDMIIVRVYYFEILKDIILDGFYHSGEKYTFLTASAGQIRTKKVVFIRERLWKQHSPTLMCGLTIDSINADGGINVNKYLAYLALCNSATENWPRFDIRKTIVVDDLETLVRGTVDYIDDKTFEITRQEMDVPINHTDGCGMILPRVSKRNFMVRLPWVKGLLASFPFDRFVREANEADPSVNHGVVTDIYGKRHDVLEEEIEIIFTKSQFKAYKYYFDWDDYIQKFIENGCSAGICNEEETYIGDSKLNYQVLQTLADMTDEELEHLAQPTVEKISKIASDRETMLKAFRAHKENRNRNDFQECLRLYPEILSVPYMRDTLKSIKDSIVRDARAGKLDVSGKYLFIIPDLYAFCEFLFLGDKNPRGLLKNGEVYCKIYRENEKLDCLRMPHLAMEHVTRFNTSFYSSNDWFHTAGIYISCHDLISKVLVNDFDGDKSLVCSDTNLISIAERNGRDFAPLFYKTAKAGAKPVDTQEMYNGMIAAYSGGKIGVISNNITRIWNSECPDRTVISWLCYQTNMTIDYAKTLYKPVIPDAVQKRIDSKIKCKTPHFFIYAKGKTKSQVEPINGSTVNRLEKLIKDPPFEFKKMQNEKFNYHMLMHDWTQREIPDVINVYNSLYRTHKYAFQVVDDQAAYAYLKMDATKKLTDVAGDLTTACDVLVKYLFGTHKSKRQNLFWLCFGDVVKENLTTNLANTFSCEKCGKRVVRTHANERYCEECAVYQKIEKKIVKCVDCGIEFEVDGIVKKQKRCVDCNLIKQRDWQRQSMQKKRKCEVS